MLVLRKLCRYLTCCTTHSEGGKRDSDFDYVSQNFPHMHQVKQHKDSHRSSSENTPTDVEKGDWVTIDIT